jgi:hypothetical protein
MVDEPDRGERREDHTKAAFLQHWPIIGAIIVGVMGYQSVKDQQKDNTAAIAAFDELLNREAFTKYAVDKTNTERDILELQKQVAGCLVRIPGK